MKKIFTPMLLICAAICGFNASAADYYVSASGNDANDGSKGAPFASLEKALETVASDDAIVIDGKVSFSKAFDASIALTDKTVTIKGTSADRNTDILEVSALLTVDCNSIINFKNLTIQGDGSYIPLQAAGEMPCFLYKRYGGVIFDNCLVKNIRSRECTGIVLAQDASLVIRRSRFENNKMLACGCFYGLWGDITLVDSQFANNSGSSEGYTCGVGRVTAGSFVAENCDFIGNVGDDYGSCIILTNEGSTARVINCNFEGNMGRGAFGQNGGDWEVLIDRCTFIDNTCEHLGCALFFPNEATTQLTVANSTFEGNHSGTGGNGGAPSYLSLTPASTANFHYVTMRNNNDCPGWAGNGGALMFDRAGDVRIINSIIEGNYGMVEGREQYCDIGIGEGYKDASFFIECSVVGRFCFHKEDHATITFDPDMSIVDQPADLWWREDGDANEAGLAAWDARHHYFPIKSEDSNAAFMGDTSLCPEELMHDQFGNPRSEEDLCIGAVPLDAKPGYVSVKAPVADAIDANAPATYFNLQGQRVANPTRGLYIRVQGNNASKVIL